VISFPQTIADAYVTPSRNVALPSAPGRQVKFLQGHAALRDGRDLVAMMKTTGVKIVMTPFAASWNDTFMREAGDRIRAEIVWPNAEAPTWDPEYRGTDSPAAST
jgi:hypothetical protein